MKKKQGKVSAHPPPPPPCFRGLILTWSWGQKATQPTERPFEANQAIEEPNQAFTGTLLPYVQEVLPHFM